MSAADAFLKARDFLIAHREDYDIAYAGFKWPRLEEFNWALDYFDVMAQGNHDTALWIVAENGEQTQLSFAEMSERSNRVANFFRGCGVVRGDRILLMLGNEVALWEIMLAAMKLGAIVIPASTLLTEADLADRLERGRVRHVLAGVEHASKFANLTGDYSRISVGGSVPGWTDFALAQSSPVPFAPDGATHVDDALLLYFTSGTTAKPKLVLHTHQSYPVGHLSTMYWLGLRPGDLHWNISSPGWAKHAWSCFFAPWNAQAAIFIFNYARFQAREILNTLGQFPVTSLCAPPTVWRMLIQEPLETFPQQLREVIGAGEPLNPEVIGRVERAWGLSLRDGYGQTETTAQIGNSPGQHVKPGSMGRVLPGYKVVLLGANENVCDEGEISIDLGPAPLCLMSGYEGAIDKTRDVTRSGFYHTGDIASRDSDGYITYVGRADDVFKAADYRISPFELESILIEHPAVAEAAVVPSPDPLRLAVPKAFVSLAPGFAQSTELAHDILAFARARLAAFKRVRRLEFAELPKTISGKIRRVELRQKEEQRGAGERHLHEYFEDDFPDLN